MTPPKKHHPNYAIQKSGSAQALEKVPYPTQSPLIDGEINPKSPALTNPWTIRVVAKERSTTARSSISRPQLQQHHANPSTLHSGWNRSYAQFTPSVGVLELCCAWLFDEPFHEWVWIKLFAQLKETHNMFAEYAYSYSTHEKWLWLGFEEGLSRADFFEMFYWEKSRGTTLTSKAEPKRRR